MRVIIVNDVPSTFPQNTWPAARDFPGAGCWRTPDGRVFLVTLNPYGADPMIMNLDNPPVTVIPDAQGTGGVDIHRLLDQLTDMLHGPAHPLPPLAPNATRVVG